ncbi:MAG TPA: ABC transporter substrate-binding protein [Thermoanaerobaculia bacterium]|nr:ABC transporter substrate-binding protein [Thermoanaerobaculia bacterium]
MRTTRRDFFVLLLGAAGARAGLAAPARRTVRIGLALGEGSAVARGATLAAEEARRTGDLLGVVFELRTPGPGAAAVVGLSTPKNPPAVLFLTAGAIDGPSPVDPRIFHVASSPRRRKEALARAGKGVRVVDWHPDLVRYGAEQLNQRFHQRFGRPMDEAAWRGWMAVKAVAEAALRSPGGDLAATLATLRFDGHKGKPLEFDPQDHHLRQPVYLVDGRGRLIGEAG